MEKSYMISEAANILGVKTRTLRQWVYDGKIKAFKYPGSQTMYIEEKEIKRMMENREYVRYAF